MFNVSQIYVSHWSSSVTVIYAATLYWDAKPLALETGPFTTKLDCIASLLISDHEIIRKLYSISKIMGVFY